MTRRKLLLTLALGLVAVVTTTPWLGILDAESGDTAPPDIPFAAMTDTSLQDPDNPVKEFHVDFARLEHEKPLSRADRAKITPANLKLLSQEQVDQIYGRLTAGPIPDGFMEGDLFFARSDDPTDRSNAQTRLAEIIGGVAGAIADDKVVDLEDLGRKIWKGKRFERDNRVLRNVIEDLAILRPLIDDESKVATTWVPRRGWLGRFLPKTEAWLLFPAKLYCGQSLLDGRRESTIIDYAYTDEIARYMAKPDDLAGRNGLRIRDEIRMVRPGFYIGRAYANRMFLLNFTLYDPETAENGLKAFADGAPIAEDCWPGEQGQAAR